MDILAGILFGGAIIGLGYVTRQGRAIPFYSTVLIVIALGYVLFAVMAGAPDVLWVESAIAIGFIALAVGGPVALPPQGGRGDCRRTRAARRLRPRPRYAGSKPGRAVVVARLLRRRRRRCRPVADRADGAIAPHGTGYFVR